MIIVKIVRYIAKLVPNKNSPKIVKITFEQEFGHLLIGLISKKLAENT